MMLAIVASGLPAWADDNAAMAAAANGFYAAYLGLPRSGGIPDATARARLAPFLSPHLTQMLTQAAAAEAHFQARNKGSPPLIEGDLFSSLFEGISSFKLGACSGDAQKGRCTASLTHADPKQKPVSWNDALLLVNTPSGWKVDDVAYMAGFAFGNSGTLTDTLQFAVSAAR
jgi:hypothetical protein